MGVGFAKTCLLSNVNTMQTHLPNKANMPKNCNKLKNMLSIVKMNISSLKAPQAIVLLFVTFLSTDTAKQKVEKFSKWQIINVLVIQ